MNFEANRDYNNVYFMSVDAQGHSKIVAENDADKADRAFDEFEGMVYKAVDDAGNERRCGVGEFWGWQGDGGLCIFWDTDESHAREAALQSASDILSEVGSLNDRLGRHKIKGSIAVRIAIHKGHLRYKGDDKRGSIHSSDLNFCAHLEKVVPSNALGISLDVQKLCSSEEQASYIPADGLFEERVIFLKGAKSAEVLQEQWRSKVAAKSLGSLIPLASDIDVSEFGLLGMYSQRAITSQFRQLFATLKERLWVMGIGVSGFRDDHELVLPDLLERGIDVRILGLEPTVEVAKLVTQGATLNLPAWCDAETRSTYNATAAGSLGVWVDAVNSKLPEGSSRIQMRYYSVVPSAALLVLDQEIFVSPYAAPRSSLKLPTLRATAAGRIGSLWLERFSCIWENASLSRPA
jgi:hypothetical protein